ncbi:hypothetical protein BC629DRAFT_1443150 [Irpex lacteus]|nr:hypothetical protein BC629DRAFT_1443150 [Irpex lacteus]
MMEAFGFMNYLPTESSNNLESQEVWLSSGPSAYKFALDTPKLIIGKADASVELLLGQDKEDVLNELSISDNKKYLGFSTDAGTVGVVELENQRITRMKVAHSNICSSVKFIPDRPSEIVSGGYDSALLHFDFKQRSVLSRFDIGTRSPAYYRCIYVASICPINISFLDWIDRCNNRDGRVWLGAGADKASPAEKKKRSRKWEGLRESSGIFTQVADGPVVASAFTASATLITCSLLGKISQHVVTYNEIPFLSLTRNVNAIDASPHWLTIGGFSEDGKGVLEVWKVPEEATSIAE